jgi:uncharacterized membrane protein
MMNNGIERYLSQLKKELTGSDRATIQDALSDAEEYLRTALSSADPAVPVADALAAIVEKYGSPAEVAAAYKEIESRTPPSFTRPAYQEPERPAEPAPVTPAAAATRPFYLRFFGVYADPRAWGALLYLIFALGTGIVYYTWAVTGLSLSLGLLVLIIGIPIAALFLLSVRGIALVEGRIVEALLGIRMPRRPLFSRRDIGWWQKIKGMLASRHTWTAIVYMILQMPLGVIYFTVIVSLVSFSVWLIGRPIFELALDLPAFATSSYYYYTPEWVMPFSIIGGILLLTLTMHLVKLTGRGHGRWAKVMLVQE